MVQELCSGWFARLFWGPTQLLFDIIIFCFDLQTLFRTVSEHTVSRRRTGLLPIKRSGDQGLSSLPERKKLSLSALGVRRPHFLVLDQHSFHLCGTTGNTARVRCCRTLEHISCRLVAVGLVVGGHLDGQNAFSGRFGHAALPTLPVAGSDASCEVKASPMNTASDDMESSTLTPCTGVNIPAETQISVAKSQPIFPPLAACTRRSAGGGRGLRKCVCKVCYVRWTYRTRFHTMRVVGGHVHGTNEVPGRFWACTMTDPPRRSERRRLRDERDPQVCCV